MSVAYLPYRHRVEIELTETGSSLMVSCYPEGVEHPDWDGAEVKAVSTGNSAMDTLLAKALTALPFRYELVEIAAEALRNHSNEITVPLCEALAGLRTEARHAEMMEEEAAEFANELWGGWLH